MSSRNGLTRNDDPPDDEQETLDDEDTVFRLKRLLDAMAEEAAAEECVKVAKADYERAKRRARDARYKRITLVSTERRRFGKGDA